MATSEVMTVAAARAGLTQVLRRFRVDPTAAPIVLGSHRKPEAVLVPFAQYAHGSTMPPVLTQIRERSRLIGRLAGASKITRVGVFGSVARGEATAASDVDLVVIPSPEASLFDLSQFAFDMEDLLGASVDVVSWGSLDPLRDRGLLDDIMWLL